MNELLLGNSSYLYEITFCCHVFIITLYQLRFNFHRFQLFFENKREGKLHNQSNERYRRALIRAISTLFDISFNTAH